MVSGYFAPSPRPRLRTAVHDGKGWPVLFMAHPDRGVMAIGCKSARRWLRLEQSNWLDTLKIAGVPVVVATPRNGYPTVQPSGTLRRAASWAVGL